MNAILIDVTRCTGCERCVTACLEENELDPVRADVDRATARDGLSAYRWSSIIEVAEGRFARKSCMHCLTPSCVSACLVGGLTKTTDGAVVYDPDKCIGCRYCMLACPFHIPRYEWGATHPFVRKCTMCASRLQEGQVPACVEACPQQAIEFGEREELLQRAHRRIREDSEHYLPHVWGESEFGGTSVLYISDVDLAALDWPSSPAEAIPHLTEPVIAATPYIGLGVASGLLGVNWIIRRRMSLMGSRSGAGKDSAPAALPTQPQSPTVDAAAGITSAEAGDRD